MPLRIPRVGLLHYIASSLYWWRNWFMGSINLPSIIEFQDSSKHFQGLKPVLFPVLSFPFDLVQFSCIISLSFSASVHKATRTFLPLGNLHHLLRPVPPFHHTPAQETIYTPICISPFICFFVSQKSGLFSYTILKLGQPGDPGALTHSLSSLTSLTPFPSPLGFPRVFVWTLLFRKLQLSSLRKRLPNLITRSDLQTYMTGSFIVILNLDGLSLHFPFSAQTGCLAFRNPSKNFAVWQSEGPLASCSGSSLICQYTLLERNSVQRLKASLK